MTNGHSAQEPPSVTAVIVNYKTAAYSIRAVRSLLACDYDPDRLRIVVVDNASGDGSVEALRAAFDDEPRVEVIASTENLGFGGGNNVVLDGLETDLALLVNSDAYAETPAALSTMVAHLQERGNERVGAVAPKILMADRLLQVDIEAKPHHLSDLQQADSRVLGAALFGLRLNGRILDDEEIDFEAGFHGAEFVAGGRYRWFDPHARMHLRVPEDIEVATLSFDLLAAPENTDPWLVFRAGEREHRAVLTPTTAESFGQRRRLDAVEMTVDRSGLVDEVNNAGSFLTGNFHGFDRGYRKVDVGQFEDAGEVFAFCGAAVLLRREALAEVGTFDHRFFLYYEDTDLAWRMRRAGWDIHYTPKAVFRHTHSASTGEWSDLFTFYVLRNRLLMLVKNAHAGAAVRAIGGFFLTLLRQLRVIHTASGRRHIALRLRIARSLASELPHARRERRRIRQGDGR